MRSTKTISTLCASQSWTTSSKTKTKWIDSASSKCSTSPSLGERTTTRASSLTRSGSTTSWWHECLCQKIFAFAAKPLLNWWEYGVKKTITKLTWSLCQQKKRNLYLFLSSRPTKATKSTKWATYWAKTGTRVQLISWEKSLRILTRTRQRLSSTPALPSCQIRSENSSLSLSRTTLTSSNNSKRLMDSILHHRKLSVASTIPTLTSSTHSSL